jgi:hypothetical protein
MSEINLGEKLSLKTEKVSILEVDDLNQVYGGKKDEKCPPTKEDPCADTTCGEVVCSL